MSGATEDEGTSATFPRAALAARVLLIALMGYIAWTTLYGQLPNIRHRAVVLALTLVAGYLVFPLGGRWRRFARAVDVALIAGTVAACAAAFLRYWDYMMAAGPAPLWALVLAPVLFVAILELSRRCIGWMFAVLVAIFALYVLFGDMIPGRLGHGGASWNLLVDMLYLSTDGVWGSLTAIYADVLVLFVLFSSLMLTTGAGQTLLDLAKVVAGRLRGGPAQVAVAASGLIGSMTGSSVTNVAMTGNFTIPMMRRLGYPREVAAGIEATASSGGQITPPLMGAGLFLMSELLQIDLRHLMLVALVPAVLFYVGVMASVYFDSRRIGIAPVPRSEMPAAREFLAFHRWGPLLLPFATLIAMIVTGYSVGLSILAAIAALAVAHMAASRSRGEVRERGEQLFRAFGEAVRPLVVLGTLVAAAGLLVAVIGLMGIGVKLSAMVLALSGGYMLPALILAGLVVIVIGMGMPTTAAYILAVSVISVTLQDLGISPLSTHMFVFYFATLSAITPPVCAAVFVAAGIAEANWLKVALHTVRFAVIKYILPFLFVFHPALLLQGTGPAIAGAIAAGCLGAVFLSAALSGCLIHPLGPIRRGLLAVAALVTLWPEPVTSLLGVLLLAGLTAENALAGRSARAARP